jgi:hypothetical protein
MRGNMLYGERRQPGQTKRAKHRPKVSRKEKAKLTIFSTVLHKIADGLEDAPREGSNRVKSISTLVFEELIEGKADLDLGPIYSREIVDSLNEFSQAHYGHEFMGTDDLQRRAQVARREAKKIDRLLR